MRCVAAYIILQGLDVSFYCILYIFTRAQRINITKWPLDWLPYQNTAHTPNENWKSIHCASGCEPTNKTIDVRYRMNRIENNHSSLRLWTLALFLLLVHCNQCGIVAVLVMAIRPTETSSNKLINRRWLSHCLQIVPSCCYHSNESSLHTTHSYHTRYNRIVVCRHYTFGSHNHLSLIHS